MAIAFVQDFATSDTFGGTSLVLTAPAGGVTQGNHLILFCVVNAPDTTLSGIADSKSNTYNLDVANVVLGSNTITIASARAATALTNTDTITLTWSVSDRVAVIASEFSGLATSSFFDKSSTNFDSDNTTHTSGSTATTTQADELLFGAHLMGTAVVWTPTNSFTATQDASYESALHMVTQYKTVAATGAYASTGTPDASAACASAIATYKAAAAGGTNATVTGVAAAGTAAVVAPPKPRPANPFSEINVRL